MSAGLEEYFTEKRAIVEATKSIPEWIASDIILTDPLIKPTITFKIINVVFEITDKRATRTFLFVLLREITLSNKQKPVSYKLIIETKNVSIIFSLT